MFSKKRANAPKAKKVTDTPSVEGGVPSADASVKVEGGDASLTVGLAAGAAAAVGGIGAAVGLSGDKPDAEVC